MVDEHDLNHALTIRAMFARIAPRYDLMNRLMTFGRDHIWRRYAVSETSLPAGGLLLDIGTGTGDFVIEALRQQPDTGQIVGMDSSRPMLELARMRTLVNQVSWIEGDALCLPYADETFDSVTSGYLARNVSDVLRAFCEQVRVVRPGGRVVCLDTSPPPPSLLRPLIRLYLKAVIPLLGRMVTGDSQAYSYLPESTQMFKTPGELAQIMMDAGLENVRFRRFMSGTVAVHIGVRPAS